MSDKQEFMAWVESRLKEAEVAIHNGDAAPRFAIWSTREPVTVMGAWLNATGPKEVGEVFRRLETSFSDCRSYSHELVAADVVGDMAYTTGFEHTEASISGEPRKYTLRVTQIYRKEDGEWKVAHRHADTVESSTGS
jgi:ketosteroid isomerase-like protein